MDIIKDADLEKADKPENKIHLIVTTLPRLMRLMLKEADLSSCCGDLNRTQLKVLMVLRHNPGIGPTEIGNILSLEKGTLTGILDFLEDKDLILRKRERTDRRRLVLNLTAAGIKLVEKQSEYLQNHIETKLETLPEETRTLFWQSLYALSEISAKLERERPARGSADNGTTQGE